MSLNAVSHSYPRLSGGHQHASHGMTIDVAQAQWGGAGADACAFPLPFVEVEVAGEAVKLDTLKLNPSSALRNGATGPAKVFNRLLQHTPPGEIVDAMVSALTNSSIVMALILTISVPATDRITPGDNTIWGTSDSDLVGTMTDLHDLLVGGTATVCVAGLLLAVGLLTHLSRIPKASVPVYMVKIGPGKAQSPDLMWRIACLLFLSSVFLKLSLVSEAWVSWTWIGFSASLTLFVGNTIWHGAYCVNETIHTMSNPQAYIWDPDAPASPSVGWCWGCRGGCRAQPN